MIIVKKPKIRFKGFTETWEQRKLGELLKYEQPTKYIVSSTDYSDNYKIPVLTAGQSFVLGYTNETFGVKNASAESPVIIFDDFTTSSHFVDFPFKVKSSAMKILTLVDCSDNIYCVNNILENIQYVPLSHERHWISIFSENFVKLPKEKCEQKKIGSLFSKLDHLITLHQRQCENLKKLKKFMLQKLFPQNGKNVPEIRFFNFTDTWEQRKFSDITFLAGKKNKDNLPLESYSITNEYGFVPQDDKFENGGTMREADKRMYYIVSPNSFAYNPARINVGSIGYQNVGKNVIVSSLYEVFKTTEDVDDRLLWHWFKSTDFQKLIMQLQEGGVRLYFYYDKLCMGELYLPSLEEQCKIGKLFDTLDRLITLHQSKCDKLKEVKKYMLQNMFI